MQIMETKVRPVIKEKLPVAFLCIYFRVHECINSVIWLLFISNLNNTLYSQSQYEYPFSALLNVSIVIFFFLAIRY